MLNESRFKTDISQILLYAIHSNPKKLRELLFVACKSRNIHALTECIYGAYLNDKHQDDEYKRLDKFYEAAFISEYGVSLKLGFKFIKEYIIKHHSELSITTTNDTDLTFVIVINNRSPLPVKYRIYVNPSASNIHEAIIALVQKRSYYQFKFINPNSKKFELRLDKLVVYCSTIEQVNETVQTFYNLPHLFVAYSRTPHFTHQLRPGMGLAVERDFAAAQYEAENREALMPGTNSFGNIMCRLLAEAIASIVNLHHETIEPELCKGGSDQDFASRIEFIKDNYFELDAILAHMKRNKMWHLLESKLQEIVACAII